MRLREVETELFLKLGKEKEGRPQVIFFMLETDRAFNRKKNTILETDRT